MTKVPAAQENRGGKPHCEPALPRGFAQRTTATRQVPRSSVFFYIVVLALFSRLKQREFSSSP